MQEFTPQRGHERDHVFAPAVQPLVAQRRRRAARRGNGYPGEVPDCGEIQRGTSGNGGGGGVGRRRDARLTEHLVHHRHYAVNRVAPRRSVAGRPSRVAEHRRYGALPRGRRRRGGSGPGRRARVDVGARALYELHVRSHVRGGRLGPKQTTERRGGELPRGGHRARSRELRPERRGGVEHREVPSDEPRGEGPGRDPRRSVEPAPSRAVDASCAAAAIVDGEPGGEEVSVCSLDERPGPKRPEQGLVHELLVHGIQHELGDGMTLPLADNARACPFGDWSTVRIEVGRRRQADPLREGPHRVKRIRRELRGGSDAGVPHHGAVRGRETLA